jgi:NADP-dependent 3-hydroxy acid dehydrogenase YdfG
VWGRRIVEAAARNGVHVLAAARHEASLRQLGQEVPSVEALALDAAGQGAPAKVFGSLNPASRFWALARVPGRADT